MRRILWIPLLLAALGSPAGAQPAKNAVGRRRPSLTRWLRRACAAEVNFAQKLSAAGIPNPERSSGK